MKRILAVCILIALFLAALAILRPSPTSGDVGIDTGTNALREQSGLTTLTTSSALQVLASQRVLEIRTDFNHHDLNGRVPACASAWGENIAWSGYDTPDFVQQWWDSPEHRANMLGNWQQQASAVYDAPDGRTYAVQLFSRGCVTAPKPSPTAAPFLLPNTSVTCPRTQPLQQKSRSFLVKMADSMSSLRSLPSS